MSAMFALCVSIVVAGLVCGVLAAVH